MNQKPMTRELYLRQIPSASEKNQVSLRNLVLGKGIDESNCLKSSLS